MAANKKPFHETVAENLIEQLKAGTAPWQKPWEPGSQGFMPMNPTTGKRYKGINAIYLMSQGRSDPRWMTYKQAAAAGAQVRRHEKGTPVQYWKFSEEQNKLDDNGKPVLDAGGKPIKETVVLERPRVFYATVFNGEQIDGLQPIQRQEQTQQWNAVERAEHILEASGASITHAPGDRAFYRSSTDSIVLPERSQFETADRYYATALHELGHWTGHPSRLDRDLSHPFGSEGYAKEELRAEIASMILGDELGIGHDPEQHAAYVGSWIKAIEDDSLEIFRAAADAEKIHNYVLAFEQKQVQEQALELSEYESRALSHLSYHNGLERLEGNHRQYLAQAEQAGDGSVVAAMHMAKEFELPLTDNGFTYEVASKLNHYRDSITADQSLSYVMDKADRETGQVQYIFNADSSAVKHVIGANFSAQTASVLRTIDKQSDMEVNANQQQFFDDVKSLSDTTLANLRLTESVERHNQQRTNTQALETEEKRQEVGMQQQTNQQQPERLLAALDPAEAQAIERTAAIRRRYAAGEIHGQEFMNTAKEALGVDLPVDWNGDIQVQGNVTQEVDGRLEIIAAHSLAVEPQFWSVYAQHETGMHQWVADFDSQNQADELADKLALVDALAEGNEHEREAKLARVHEARVYRDPNSTDEDISAAKDARKTAEAAAMLNDTDMQRRIAEREREEREQQAQPTQEKQERAYINVPYREKDEAKGLGARWDRQQRSWYVPPGVDTSPFAKWAQGATQGGTQAPTDTQVTQPQGREQQPAQERVYLAVSYGERGAAKAAGSKWDKAAKSWYAGPGADMERLQRWLPENVASQQDPAMTPREEFAEALKSLGCVVSDKHPIMDGKKHRITVEGDKKGEQAGFYVGHLDGHPAGYIKNNRTGIDMKWKSKGYSLSPEEKAKLQAETAEKLAAREAEQAKLHEATAQRVSRQAENLVPVTEPTPYMCDKGIRAHAGALTDSEGQKTYIPAIDAEGKQWTMQYIQEDGTKRFAKDSRKEGCFHVVGGGLEALASAPALVIQEGYATATTNAEALGFATVAAFDSGNLSAVAQDLHKKFPDKPVIVLGDDDQHLELTQGINPGRGKAQEAAKAVGGKAIFPVFAPGEATYPAGLEPVTPQSYREHHRAVKALEDAPNLTKEETADLKRALLSDDQMAALDRMKRHTDFNDLAGKSQLGRAGVERQVGAAVRKVIEEAERKQELRQEQKQRRTVRVG